MNGRRSPRFPVVLAASWLGIFLTAEGLVLPVYGVDFAAETFDYAPGELQGQSGGDGWLGAWFALPQLTEVVDTNEAPLMFEVEGGGLLADQGWALELSGNSDSIAYRAFESPLDLDVVYIRFLFRFRGVIHDNDFLGVWFDGVLSTDHTGVPNIGLKSNQGDGSGSLDFFARTVSSREVYAEDIVVGETYCIVGRLSKSVSGPSQPYDEYALWVNPAYEDAETPPATSTGASSSGSLTQLGVRVVNFSAGDSVHIAALRLGTEWDDVVPPSAVASPRFRRGDANADGSLDLTDAVHTLNHLFLSGPVSRCTDGADADDNGEIQITDAVFTLNGLFLSGPEVPAPGSFDCGEDPTDDGLLCAAYPQCD